MTKRINLHCHSQYSDGAENITVLAMEHIKLGFSCFVVTDHVYPSELYSRVSLNINKYIQQKSDIRSASKYLDFVCLQGIELALYHEEILVFGQQTILEILNYLEENKHKAVTRDTHFALLDIIKKYKKSNAAILCHPAVHSIDKHKEFYDKLFDILDGYEKENNGIDMFGRREIPNELKNKKQFFNSDAHLLISINNCKNFTSKTIKDETDLIKFIKSKEIVK